MMTKKSFGLGVLSLALIGTAAYATGALAYRGNSSQTGPNYTPERHTQMEKAFESGDYNAWKNLMNGRGRVTEVVKESNFNRFSEMHRLMQEGKTDEANKIRTELGLGQGQGRAEGRGFLDANGDGVCDRMQ